MPRQIRKRRVEDDEDEGEQEDEGTLQQRIQDARMVIRARDKKQGVGAESLAKGNAKFDADEEDGEDERAKALAGNFSAAAAAVADTGAAEDPNMLAFIENELAKRRGAERAEQFGDEEGGARQKTEEEMLWETPDELSVRKVEGEETADRWLTGIVEVQLPMEYKVRNVEDTEKAKQKMLEKQRNEKMGIPEAVPAPAPAGFVSKRKKNQMKSNIPSSLSANFTLHRSMFAKQFGHGGGAKKTSTTFMQEHTGEKKKIQAKNVASDDIVFKKFINNERKKQRR